MKSFTQLLKEMSSLSRVNSHVKNPSMSFGVISAMSNVKKHPNFKNFSEADIKAHEKVNEENHTKLKSKIRDMKYGYIEHTGLWTDADGEAGHEKSLLVPNISKDELITLGKHYNQEAVIHKSGTDFNMIDVASGKGFIDFQHGKDKNLDLAADKVKDYYSKLMWGSHSDKKYVFIPKDTDTENSQ